MIEFIDAFKLADRDNSGYIDRKELEFILNEQGEKKLNSAQIKATFNLFDKNHDGKIDLQEFMKGFIELMKL